MKPITRIEHYLAAIAGLQDYTPEEPITRLEKYLAYINGKTDSYPEPVTRIDQLIVMQIEKTDLPFEPIRRLERILAGLCNEPVTREESFWLQAVEAMNSVKPPEYIEFNGTQYVALDLQFTKDTVCRIKFNTTIATGDCIMGSSSAFRFFNARGGTYLDWGRGSGGDRITGGVTPEGKTHYREFGNNYVKDLDTGKIIISGEKYGDNIRYDGLRICIMGNPYQKCAQGIVYLAEVIQNGETVRSLLPYIGDAGELGFRDSITGNFYKVINKEAASVMMLGGEVISE